MSDSETGTLVSRSTDDDMRGVPTASMRAARRACEIAARTGTPLIIRKDGRLAGQVVDAGEVDHSRA